MNRLSLWSLALLTVLAGCTTRYIGNSMIEDTAINREIIDVLEQYRRAVEDKDVERILDLTSSSFFEDPGTPGDPSDDYDKVGLRERLEETFSRVEDQTLRLEPRKIEFNDDRTRAFVIYRYDLRYRVNLPSASEWREAQDLGQVQLQREPSGWKFISGI